MPQGFRVVCRDAQSHRKHAQRQTGFSTLADYRSRPSRGSGRAAPDLLRTLGGVGGGATARAALWGSREGGAAESAARERPGEVSWPAGCRVPGGRAEAAGARVRVLARAGPEGRRRSPGGGGGSGSADAGRGAGSGRRPAPPLMCGPPPEWARCPRRRSCWGLLGLQRRRGAAGAAGVGEISSHSPRHLGGIRSFASPAEQCASFVFLLR